MKVLLLGARGMLATDLIATAPAGTQIDGRDLPEFDITDASSVARAIEEAQPDWIINCAAYTAVDKSEEDVSVAMAVNGAALGTLGSLAKRLKIRVLHVSTDYVFDGRHHTPYREDDPVSPVNAYGASKLEGERQLQASGAESLILRTQWLFGIHGKSFPRTMLERANKNARTRVVADQTGRLTSTVDLSAVIWSLIAKDARGIFHAANEGIVTWYEVARHIFAHAGHVNALSPCTTADYPTPARRPQYSVLDTSKLESTLGRRLRRWELALDEFLERAGKSI